MALPMDSYNHQVAAIQSQLNSLQRPNYNAFNFNPVHKVVPVEGMAGAEAFQREMPAGSSEILAHKTENILYLVARDDNNVPLPITPMRFEPLQPSDDPTGYVTKADLEKFKEDILAVLPKKGEAE